MILESSFYRNGAAVKSSGNLFVGGSNFSNNFAVSDGAAIGHSGTAQISRSNFSENSARYGGIVQTDGDLSVEGSSFSRNFSSNIIIDTNYRDRSAPDNISISNTTFYNNKAASGVFAGPYSPLSADVYSRTSTNIYSSTFTGNISYFGPAILPRDAGFFKLTNSIIDGNKSNIFGRFYNPGARPSLEGYNIYDGILLSGDVYVASVPLSQTFAEVRTLSQDGMTFEAGAFEQPSGVVGVVKLLPGGAAEDQGDLTALPRDDFDLDQDGDREEPIPFDALGNPRIAGFGLDLGASEILRQPEEGTASDDFIIGVFNSQTLLGRNGDDTLVAFLGDDILIGGAGADLLIGGQGRDTASFEFAGRGVSADLANEIPGRGSATGDEFFAIENLIGTNFSDRLRGDSEANVINGGAGDDLVIGRAGNDTVVGGAGADTVAGNNGQDHLTGGSGQDVFKLFNAGESRVGLQRRDVVGDFVQGEDRIDLTLVDADLTRFGNQDFQFIGTSNFTESAGELRFFQIKSEQITILQGDLTGDAEQDFQIELNGVIELRPSDFEV